MSFVTPPIELQQVAPDVLLDYLKSAVSRLASTPALASRLGVLSVDVQHAVQATFDELCASESRNGSSPQLKLIFRHDCQNLTCLNPRCNLCCQNPNKRCPDSVNFSPKYLEKNPLKSKCGASIRIEVVNAATGELAHPQLLHDVQLELSMLDGKKFASLHETGEDMASCELFLTPKGKELLNPGRLGTQTQEFRVRMPLTARGQAVLTTDLNVQVSSEAMLGGQKSPYKLLVRAVNLHTGSEVPYITFVVSEDFVVATPRVAKAVKAEIPCVDDLVSKLEDIGDKTHKKLQDIMAAAEACGVHNLTFPDRSITTVGQFKQLVEFSNQDPRFTDKLKQYLIPNKARDHVALAVENDKRLRMWYPEPNNVEGGLLFRSVRARVDLEHPDVMVQHKVLPDGTTQPDLTPCTQAQGEKKDILRRLMGKAKEDWKAADHPNWSIRDMDSADFLDSHPQPGQGVVYAPIPETRQLDHTRLGSGSGSFGGHQQGSGHLTISPSQSGQLGLTHSPQGSGQFGHSQGSGHLGMNPSQGSGHLGMNPSQGSGQLGANHNQGSGQLILGQLLGNTRSGSLTGAASWQGVGRGQYGGSRHLSGAGQARSESPFSSEQNQHFHGNGGAAQYSPRSQQPSSNGFAGFAPAPTDSPFLAFNAQQPSMAEIFPGQVSASHLQPATSQAALSSITNWPSASGTGSGSLPHHFSDHGRTLQDLQNSLSSQGSPSIGNAPFGSHMAGSSGGADGNSPASTQNSGAESAPNGQSYYPLLGAGNLDRVSSGLYEPGAKRMRAPKQPQPDINSFSQHPSTEIAMQQQMLKQRHNSNSSPGLVPPSPFGGLGQQDSDPSQLHMGQPATGLQGMQASQQHQPQLQQHAGPAHHQLGNPDLQKRLVDQLNGLPDVNDAIFEDPFLLSEGSMHFMGGPSQGASPEGNSGRPPTNPAMPPPQLHNYLNDTRQEAMRNHVRFSPIPSDNDWKLPEPSASPTSSSPLQVDLDPRPSSGELIPNANPSLNGVPAARAQWAQKERWSSGNIFASFGSRVRRQLGESGKSDGLESMRDISEFLPDLEDMEDDQPDDQPLS